MSDAEITDGNVHEARASGRRIQQTVTVVDLPRSGKQGVDRYSELRLVAEVDDLARRRKLARLGYPDTAGRGRGHTTGGRRRRALSVPPWSCQVLVEGRAQGGRAQAGCLGTCTRVSHRDQAGRGSKHLPDLAKIRWASVWTSRCQIAGGKKKRMRTHRVR